MNIYKQYVVNDIFEPSSKQRLYPNIFATNNNKKINKEYITNIKDENIIEFDLRYNFLRFEDIDEFKFRRSMMLRIGYVSNNKKYRIVLYKVVAYLTNNILIKLKDHESTLIDDVYKSALKNIDFSKYDSVMFIYLKIKKYNFNDTKQFETITEKQTIDDKPILISDICMGKTISEDILREYINKKDFKPLTEEDINYWSNITNLMSNNESTIRYCVNDKEKAYNDKLLKSILNKNNISSLISKLDTTYNDFMREDCAQVIYSSKRKKYYVLHKIFDYTTCAGNYLEFYIDVYGSSKKMAKKLDFNEKRKLIAPYLFDQTKNISYIPNPEFSDSEYEWS